MNLADLSVEDQALVLAFAEITRIECEGLSWDEIEPKLSKCWDDPLRDPQPGVKWVDVAHYVRAACGVRQSRPVRLGLRIKRETSPTDASLRLSKRCCLRADPLSHGCADRPSVPAGEHSRYRRVSRGWYQCLRSAKRLNASAWVAWCYPLSGRPADYACACFQ